jgi:hypothetical protein
VVGDRSSKRNLNTDFLLDTITDHGLMHISIAVTVRDKFIIIVASASRPATKICYCPYTCSNKMEAELS